MKPENKYWIDNGIDRLPTPTGRRKITTEMVKVFQEHRDSLYAQKGSKLRIMA